MTRPCRRITLQLSHIGLTLGRTFTGSLPRLIGVSGKTPLERPCPLRQALGVGGRTGLAPWGTGLDGSARRPYRPSVAWPGAAVRVPALATRARRAAARQPGTVRTSGPSSVTAIVCSKCAERLPSTVPRSSHLHHHRLFTTHVDHGLDSEHHAGAQLARCRASSWGRRGLRASGSLWRGPRSPSPPRSRHPRPPSGRRGPHRGDGSFTSWAIPACSASSVTRMSLSTLGGPPPPPPSPPRHRGSPR